MTTEQVQEVPQAIQPVQQAPVEPKKKLNLSTIVILLIVILLVGIGGVYAGIKIGKKQVVGELVQKVTPAPISQPTVIPTPDETVYTEQGRSASWKTYNDTKYQYSFKYPKSWTDQTGINDKDLGNFTIGSIEGEKIHGTIFTGIPNLENDKKNLGSSKSFVINEQKYLFVTYVECDGPGCNLSRKHLEIFDQILSTFKFLE